MKSEPDAYSIDNLEADGTTIWDGIRNYQARNFMRKMNIGDQVFFYHSNCKPPGIVGLMEVIDKNITDEETEAVMNPLIEESLEISGVSIEGI